MSTHRPEQTNRIVFRRAPRDSVAADVLEQEPGAERAAALPSRGRPLLPLVLDQVPPGLRQALAQEGVPFVLRSTGAAEGRFVLFDSQIGPCRWLAADQTAIDVNLVRQGLRRDPLAALTDETARLHSWQIGGYEITEQIARYDKRELRHFVVSRLRNEIQRHGGVWLRVSAYPYPYRGAVNFRIDYDDYHPRRFDATLEIVAKHAGATSHYVNAAAFRRLDDELVRMRGLDVGSHGYWHHTYLSLAENLRNLRRGITALRNAGIEPAGFVAPHGRFNPALLAALEEEGISHSSEFQLAYDELPFFPRGSHVLQIPIHPVCLELFLEAARRRRDATGSAGPAVATATSYLRRAVESKYAAGDPLFFYGHPTSPLGCHPQALEAVFEAAASCPAVWPVTLSEFGAWWRVRSGVRLTVQAEGDRLEVTTPHVPTDYRVAIEFCRAGQVAILPLENPRLQFSPEALVYERRAWEPAVRAVRIDRPQGLRAHLKQLLDWEKVTPIEEIAADNWRGWAKKTLRRWRENQT